MNIKKVVVVSKDIGGANVTIPLANLMKSEGIEVVPVLEGLAAKRFEDAGFKPYFKGTVNFQVEPFTLDARAVLEQTKPDVVICSEGAPIHLEEQFGLAANSLEIPLVEINDYWRGVVRSMASPQLVCAMDEYDRVVSQESFPSARVEIVGNVGVSANSAPVPLRMRDYHSRFDLVVVYFGTGASTEEELHLLVECLKRTRSSCCLVPCFHPKFKELRPNGGDHTFGEIWNGIIRDAGVEVATILAGKPEDVVSGSDIVCASFSTFLTTAASLGKVTVVLRTPKGKEVLESVQLEEVPQVALGCAHKVSVPTDLSELDPPSGEARAKLLPYDPAKVLAAIRSL